ncbi:unnamed protein product [Mytilus coruscus]|uniref:TIR domain-containing protein n=1 Tax=Mytilus coruscus TaxID=42192 RepID=A0A6J8D6I2_MYTCO|nr:unnamed protein product [Mytilus coruscus]
MTTVSNIFSDKTISNLRSLEKLEIDVPAFFQKRDIFGEGYIYLIHLRSLNVGTCDNLIINTKIFEYMPLLTHILFDITCNIHITAGGHRSLKNIRQFYVHRLVDTLLPFLRDLINELKLTPIETLSFRNTFEDSFDDHYYPWNLISRKLQNSSLKHLLMTENKLGESFPLSKLDPPPPSLQSLNLSSNKLKKFAIDLGNIRNLSLQNNNPGGFLRTLSYKLLNESSSLEFIDLSANSIETLTFKLFKGQPNLKYINLSLNKLNRVTFGMSRLNNLRYLDLSSNNFTTLDEKAMVMFDEQSKNTFFTVNLRKNALQCTCNTLTFLKWISKSKVDLLLNDKCILGDACTVVSFYPLDSIIQQLQKECNAYAYLVIALSISLVVTFAVLILALVFKYRWKLRNMFYLAKSKHYSYKASTDDGEYTYDAFISYSDDDRSFVLKDFIANLEIQGMLNYACTNETFYQAKR